MLVDSKSWKESWITLEDLLGGGQGTVKKVQHKESSAIGFLKILNKQNDSERRARFYREATAYDSCENENIPRLLESNSHYYSDKEYKLYIVAEFMFGLTLTQYIETNGSLDVYDASKITLKLLDIVEYYHKNGWVHRDIKPDNIILDDGLMPKLLDFGMSFKGGITPDFGTELGQEVGNRFLRLPELRMDSPVKQDVRSDLSFVGGILKAINTTANTELAENKKRYDLTTAIQAPEFPQEFEDSIREVFVSGMRNLIENNAL